jgi:hypothetical protein
MQMLHKTISMDCGVRQLARARDALSAIPGVVAAEMVTGRNAVRIWQSEDTVESLLAAAIDGCGVTRWNIT